MGMGPRNTFASEHKWAMQQLSAYLDDELSPSDRARTEAHLKTCPRCTEELRSLRRTVSLVAEMPALRAPRPMTLSADRVQPRRMPFWTTFVALRGATAAVAALLLLVLASDLFLPRALAPRAPTPPIALRQAAPAEMALPVEKPAEAEALQKIEPTEEAVGGTELPLLEAAPAPLVVAKATPAPQPTPAAIAEAKLAARAVSPTVQMVEPPPAAVALEAKGIGGGPGVEATPVGPMAPAAGSLTQMVSPVPPPTGPLILQDVAPSPQPAATSEAIPLAQAASPTAQAMAAAEVVRSAATPEPSPRAARPPFPWRFTLRWVEVVLAGLTIALAASALIVRYR